MSATLRQPGRSGERWLTPGQRKLLAACAATVGVIAAYKVYRSERLKATQKALQTAADTLARCNDAASSVGQIAAVLARDINIFLSSDASEVPQSLKQLAKLARSSDVQDTLAACVASSLKGVMDMDARSRDFGEPTLVDKVIQAVLSDRGQTLVGLAVRTAAQQSTETFCAAVRSGLEAALQAAGAGSSQQSRLPTALAQQQQSCHNIAVPHGTADGFFSAMSTPISSPQQPRQHTPNFAQAYSPGAGYSNTNMHPVLSSVMSVLSSPQLLQAVDGLVSTCVSSTVGAYLSQARPSESMLSSTLHTLSQPVNKALVIDIMSQVSATFCREMAAACVAPAAAVASRPASRLSDSPGMLCLEQEDQHLRLQRQLSASPIRVVADSSSRLPAHKQGPSQQQQQLEAAAAMHHSVSEGAISHASDAAAAAAAAASISEPSSPQSGPGTPEPSVTAAEAGGSSHAQQPRQSPYGSFAGSAVAGLILRRQSLAGLLSGGCAGGMTGAGPGCGPAGPAQVGTLLVDPATLGPMSTAVSLFVQAARFQEFRSLMVDVSRSSTREFVHSLLPRGWLQAVRGASSVQGGRSTSGVDVAVTVALQRVYTAMSVLILLMVYALSPKILLVEGGL